jgi:regulator of protease activity HflC (stomatin/prohibitin superfamily)
MEAASSDYLGEYPLGEVNKDKAMLNLPSILMEKPLELNDTTYLSHPMYQQLLDWGIKVLSAELMDVKMSPESVAKRREVYAARKNQEIAGINKKTQHINALADKDEEIVRAEGKKQALALEGQGHSVSMGLQLNALKKEGLTATEAANTTIARQKWESISANDKIIVEGEGRVSDGAKWGAGSSLSKK